MVATLAQGMLGAAAGSTVGLSLGLIGGGGSILAVPLLIYLVDVESMHAAIGTSAVAVAANAAAALVAHARSGTVKWPCALLFAAAGMAGALVGATAGKMVDGERLLALFAVLMLVVAALMLRKRSAEARPEVRLSRENAAAVVGLGVGSGLLSGFFGIGGGFLIVPALMLATGMPLINAIGSSLVGVTAFGATTAASYASSGLVDWGLAAAFIGGGLVGIAAGTRLARHLAARRGLLSVAFAGTIAAVAIYMLIRRLA